MRLMAILFLLGSAVSASAYADQKILDCNFNFGEIAQIQIFRSQNAYSFALLTNTGRWLPLQSLSFESWKNRMIRFEYRGERYEFFSSDGHDWRYKSFLGSSTSPSIIGSADCD